MHTPSDKAVRHWFVTGASGGLGRHLTEHALQRGDRVTATVRRPAALEDLCETYGDRLTVEILDVTRPADVDKVVAYTEQASECHPDARSVSLSDQRRGDAFTQLLLCGLVHRAGEGRDHHIVER